MQKAAEWFFKAADLNPNDPNPYLFLGKIQSREITESAGYRERLARFANLTPESALANYYYAVSLRIKAMTGSARIASKSRDVRSTPGARLSSAWHHRP